MAKYICFKDFLNKIKLLKKIKSDFDACKANTNFKPDPITQYSTYYPCDELKLGEILSLVIDGCTNSKVSLKENIIVQLDNGIVNEDTIGYFKKMTENFCTKMTPREFYLSINTHQLPLKIKNALYSYEDKLDGLINYHKNKSKRHALKEIYECMTEAAEQKAYALFKGHNTELEVINYLAQNIESEDLYIYQNVHIGKNEHDCIILCNKAFLTLEIKDHITDMYWDKEGNFSESIHGIRYDDCRDPYQQTLEHEKSFNKMIGSELIEGIVVLANDDAKYDSSDDDIAVRIVRPAQLVAEINEMPDSFNHEHIIKIDQIIEHLKVESDPKFNFPDLKKIDELFLTLIDILCLDVEIEYDQNREHIATELLPGSDIIDDTYVGGVKECQKLIELFNSKKKTFIAKIDGTITKTLLPKLRNAIMILLIGVYFTNLLIGTKYYYPSLIKWGIFIITINLLIKFIRLALTVVYSSIMKILIINGFDSKKISST